MIDKNLRDLERFQDPIRLKLFQRRLGQGVYIQEFPRPIKVFNDTELLINILECGYKFGGGDVFEFRTEYGNGYGYGGGHRDGNGYGIGSGHGVESVIGNGYGYGYGKGLGYGSGCGGSEGSYTRRLREKHNG